MSYQVLARKWRPSNFTQVVGQEHVVQSLMNALEHNRLHHAYLFTGTRGVGKTTLARILAKAVNCENLQQYNPCGRCRVCTELDEGRFLDLIEVDAASRTKVEDTRDLLDNAQYAPNYARYKVYLIDEVHMLSSHSFNALLKTLEEPPPHVKFLLATTDPQKIPVTVLSRCLQFNLKRLLPKQIFDHMQTILDHEKIDADPQALHMLARAADGSMRDGLSLLDQAIVYGAGKVSTDEVNRMLGTVAQRPVEALLISLAENNAEALLGQIDEIADVYSDFGAVLQQILYILHRVALAQQIPHAIAHEFDQEMILSLAGIFSQEDVQLYYQIALLGQKDLELSPDSRMGFEMVMLRMLAFKPLSPEFADTHSQPTTEKTRAKPIKPSASTAPVLSHSGHKKTDRLDSNTAQADVDWSGMIDIMKLESLTRELANNCVLISIDDQACCLTLDASHQQLLTPLREKKLQQALQTYRGMPLKLSITIENAELDTPAAQLARDKETRQQAAVDAIHADANVEALKEYFDARILPGTIEPV